MYKFFGWINVIILLLLVLPCILNFYNKLLKERSFKISVLILAFRKLHKKLGIFLLFMPLIHGYMALGEIKPHTGSILYLFILLTIIHGAIYSHFKNKFHFSLHKLLSIFSIFLFLLHFFYPWALSSIFK
ncbi:MAG: hypothetical protein ACTHW2_07200 [Tissierella sp.]|uniref:hypothetical protein n=1 Tax=Tissierella sp. TaxID=41274 RepID=UPI003F9C79FB